MVGECKARAGNICSSALVKYYEEKGYNVLPEKIEHLDYKEKKFKLEGLHSLVNKIATLIEENIKKREVALVATGGFKAEIAYATLIGILFKVKVYYIHEKFKDIIDLPPIPIHLDVRFWHKYEEDLKWIMQYRTEDEIKNRFKGEVPKEFSFLLNYDKDTKQYSLSPAGHAFYRAYSFRKPEIELIGSRRIKIKRMQDHTTLFGRPNYVDEISDKDVRILLERVSSLPYVTLISLGKFNKQKQNKTYLKWIISESTKVHYKLYCEEGIEDVVINIESGKSKDLVKFIGKKAYP
ncbi:MAG: putative CRISPR-associated protein [Methanosarcinales archaeon]